MDTQVKRRNFLKTTAVTGSLIGLPIIKTSAQTKKYRTATIGAGWWGMNITRYAIASEECDFVALCDVDENQLKPAAAEVEKLTGKAPKLYKDYRELLEKEKPEIVIVATSDHWHALPTIAACEIGAHVYVEKPICHTVLEGKAMVAAARKNNRVVQVGTHRRFGVHNTSAMEFLKAGKAGKIGSVKCFVHSGYGDRVQPDSEPPAGLDWDFWCGPAPLVPFNRSMHPRGFRQFLDYGNGQLGDWGIHWLDQILWWANDEVTPHTIFSNGGRFVKKDNTNSPDTQTACYSFENFTVTWEHRFYGDNPQEKTGLGTYFYGTKGVFHLGWQDGWTYYPANRNDQVIHEDCVFNNKDKENIKENFANFLDSIKNNRKSASDIERGYRATCMSLLAMISLKTGRSLKWDQAKSEIIGDPDASKFLRREYRAPWKYPEV